ncbi:MAG: MBL fold metallo-hydrolase [Deltaproteobacteria bacterium]|nr:MBL fold metallo-hydrolase [Deltaproteobacteria bacterium]
MYVRQIPVGPMKNFAYLLGPADSAETWVVDPAWDVPGLLAAAAEDGRRLAGAVMTHSHGDHCNGLPGLLAAVDVPVYVHATEAAFSPELRRMAGDALRPVRGGDRLRLGAREATFLHTPGHTPGSQCLWCEAGVVSGDTLFVGACGRCDLPGGDPEAMYRSLTGVLGALPPQTPLLPGHDYGHSRTTSLGAERAGSPALSHGAVADFVAWRMRPRR